MNQSPLSDKGNARGGGGRRCTSVDFLITFTFRALGAGRDSVRPGHELLVPPSQVVVQPLSLSRQSHQGRMPREVSHRSGGGRVGQEAAFAF